MDGANAIAAALKEQGVDYCFGVVGIPVIEIGSAMQEHGIQYFGMRNEQAASYAAQAVGYMTGRPGACLVVSGPGLVHALAGLANAQSNAWPMILIAGSSDLNQRGMGAFQEMDQVEAARQFCKLAVQVECVERIPYHIEKAVRTSIYGRPGAVYVDIPGNLVLANAETVPMLPRCVDPPRSLADPAAIEATIAALRGAKNPLVIVGKGCASGFAENEVRAFIDATQLPFLPTPMGKGVVPDTHPLNIGAARSLALKSADCIILLGARLNWILHFGKTPRFLENVKIIQADICPEEIGNNSPGSIPLVGDLKSIAGQLHEAAKKANFTFPASAPWMVQLKEKVQGNVLSSQALYDDRRVPMTYYHVLNAIKSGIPSDSIIVSEGANTMDIGRTVLPNIHARHRLDAGSFGTMGVGLGFAIAAAAVHPNKKIVAVEGDSAFGFSAAEMEVACRYKLPITIFVVNNNGIYMGVDDISEIERNELPVTTLLPNARYEKIAEAFGGKGYFVTTPEELAAAIPKALADDVPSVVNIMIEPTGQRKPQEFQWLTRKDPTAKL